MKKHECEKKYMVLGVAFSWEKRKGLDVFEWLASDLPEEYQIILVGTNEEIDRRLSENIISIHRTHNQKELAEIYTAADVFVNPTREDNFPTTNIESLACGTPVVTFRTGGSPEIIDETCGITIDCDDLSALKAEIMRICEDHPFSSEACMSRAKIFDMNSRYADYLEIYATV